MCGSGCSRKHYPVLKPKKMTKRINVYIAGIFLLLSATHLSFRSPLAKNTNVPVHGFYPMMSVSPMAGIAALLQEYDLLHLDSAGLSLEAFTTAVSGYQHMLEKGLLDKSGLLTIIDFSQSSKNKRFYVLDLMANRILFNTYVAHGRRSGLEYAKSFSNRAHSNKSSLGFYVTGNTYTGGEGYSLRLSGLDKGFNDKALARDIVLHGSWYVNEQFLTSNGLIGRSLGCPAVPMEGHEEIIDNIKEGSCLFIYFPDKNYLRHSSILKG
jgi:hypothetical protein